MPAAQPIRAHHLGPALAPPATEEPTPPAGAGLAAGRRLDAQFLLSLPLLCHLPGEMAGLLARSARIRRFARGAQVVEQDQNDHALFIVLAGTARKVRRGPKGRTLILDLLAPGDHFGELALIDGQPHSASVRCVTAVEVLVLNGADFIHCLNRSSDLLDALLRSLVLRVRNSNQRIALLALNDVRGCVVRHLLDRAEPQGDQLVVRQAVSRQGIADMIGASREMVSRVMMDLVRSGAIEARPDGSTRVDGLLATAAPKPATGRRAGVPAAD